MIRMWSRNGTRRGPEQKTLEQQADNLSAENDIDPGEHEIQLSAGYFADTFRKLLFVDRDHKRDRGDRVFF